MQRFCKRTIPTICRFYISWERKIVENFEIHNIPIFVDLKAEELKNSKVWRFESLEVRRFPCPEIERLDDSDEFENSEIWQLDCSKMLSSSEVSKSDEIVLRVSGIRY